MSAMDEIKKNLSKKDAEKLVGQDKRRKGGK